MVSVPVNPGSNLPLAEQVASYFRRLIQVGELTEGEILPPSNRFTNASQPVVMQAYQQLQLEGLVKVRRTRGTVVTAGRSHQCLAILLHRVIHTVYTNALVNGLMQQAVFQGNPPRVYMLNPRSDNVEKTLPPTFLADLANNEIAGVFAHPYRDDESLGQWFEQHNLPYVQLSHYGGGSHVEPDNRQLLEKGVERLLELECRRLMVFSTFHDIAQADALKNLGDLGDATVEWQLVRFESRTATGVGRDLAKKWLRQTRCSRHDGVLLSDDWVATGFIIQALADGISIPADLRLAVACHRDQLLNVFDECERFILEPVEVIEQMVALLEHRISNPSAPPENIFVPYHRLGAPVNTPVYAAIA